MTESPNIIAICGRPKVAEDVISGGDVKTCAAYCGVNFAIASWSSFRVNHVLRLHDDNMPNLDHIFDVTEQKCLTKCTIKQANFHWPFKNDNVLPNRLSGYRGTATGTCLNIDKLLRFANDREVAAEMCAATLVTPYGRRDSVRYFAIYWVQPSLPRIPLLQCLLFIAVVAMGWCAHVQVCRCVYWCTEMSSRC